MIDINDFTTRCAEQLENTDPSIITPETNFWELDEWSSIVALSVVAMIDEEYDVILNAKDVKDAKTISDLYTIVKNKMDSK